MKVSEILSELEKDKLKLVASDKVMLGAVKKVVLSAVYFDGTLNKEGIPDPLKNFALALASRPGVKNEDLGAETRALLQARELVAKGIDKIKLLQTNPKGREKQNPAI